MKNNKIKKLTISVVENLKYSKAHAGFRAKYFETIKNYYTQLNNELRKDRTFIISPTI